MQIIKIGLALVGLFSLCPNFSWAHDNIGDSFSPMFAARVKTEALIDRCAEVFARDARSNPATRPLKSVALERLGEAICSQPEIAHMFLSNQWDSDAPLNQRPLLLEIHDSTVGQRSAVLAVLRQTLYNSRFTKRYINGININVAPEPRALNPEKINTLTIDIDNWIRRHEKDSPGSLLKWLNFITQARGSFVSVVAFTKHDRAHYEVEGHSEVVQFLDRFQTVYLNAHKEFCRRELDSLQ